MKKKLLIIALSLIFSCNFLYTQSTYFSISDQGMTSNTHKENIGKILWSSKRIQFNAQDNIQYINKFKVGESIYGRGYLPKCLYNLSIDDGNNDCLNPNNEYEIRIVCDDIDLGILKSGYFPDQDWTTFQVTLSLSQGDSEDGINKGVTSKWAQFVNEMNHGEHQIQIQFWGGKSGCERKKYAEGSFILIKDSGSKVKGQSEELPNPKMKNAKLEKEMIEAVKKQGWKNEHPIGVIILENDWRIIKDALGNIIAKEINTFIILKDNNGNCRANDISFRQTYKGHSYGPTEFYGFGLKSIPVDCCKY
mgnify:CR=1 FL=1